MFPCNLWIERPSQRLYTLQKKLSLRQILIFGPESVRSNINNDYQYMLLPSIKQKYILPIQRIVNGNFSKLDFTHIQFILICKFVLDFIRREVKHECNQVYHRVPTIAERVEDEIYQDKICTYPFKSISFNSARLPGYLILIYWKYSVEYGQLSYSRAKTEKRKNQSRDFQTYKPGSVEQDLLSPLNVIRFGLGK